MLRSTTRPRENDGACGSACTFASLCPTSPARYGALWVRFVYGNVPTVAAQGAGRVRVAIVFDASRSCALIHPIHSFMQHYKRRLPHAFEFGRAGREGRC
jgi:hypothetical protein